MFFSAIRTSAANDSLRAKLAAEIKWQADYLDGLIKYVKLRGWVSQPPLYPNVPKETPEQLDAGEASHIWDHLTFTYDGMSLLDMYAEVARDGDWKSQLGALSAALKRSAPSWRTRNGWTMTT